MHSNVLTCVNTLSTYVWIFWPCLIILNHLRYSYIRLLMANQVLVNVLKAPEHLQYQLAFLSSVSRPTTSRGSWSDRLKELREIFQGAPSSSQENASAEDTSGKRKPIEGDCPICFMEFDPKTEEIVWCKAACGNNVHKVCFQRWAMTQRANGVRCVYW